MGKPGSPFPAAVVALLGAASVVAGSQTRGPTGGDAGTGLSTAAARPNILFAIADDMGHASAYGTRWVRTPNFDRLAGSIINSPSA